MRKGTSWLIIVLAALIAPACDGGVHARGVVRNAEGEALLNAEVRLEGKEQVFRDVSRTAGCFSVGGVVAPGRRDYQLTVSKTGYRPFQTVVKSLSRAQLLVTLERPEAQPVSRAVPLEVKPTDCQLVW